VNSAKIPAEFKKILNVIQQFKNIETEFSKIEFYLAEFSKFYSAVQHFKKLNLTVIKMNSAHIRLNYAKLNSAINQFRSEFSKSKFNSAH